MSASGASIIEKIEAEFVKTTLPEFRVGDTIRVHGRIVEGTKERIQIFEGLVIRRNKGNHSTATFTVRKVSYDIGVERTFLLHSPRIEKIQVVNHGEVRRARLFYLRPLRGKAARIKTKFVSQAKTVKADTTPPEASESSAQETA